MKLPLWAKLTITLATIVVVLTAGAVVTVMAGFSGGISHILHRQPDPRADDVQRARVNAATTLQANVARVTDTVLLDSRLGRPALVATGSMDSCLFGAHNWKQDSAYDLDCGLHHDVVVAFDAEDFPAQALGLHRALLADGWASKDSGLGAWEGDSARGVNHMPDAYYVRQGLFLALNWADAGSEDLEFFLRGPSPGHVKLGEQTIREDLVRAALAPGRYVVFMGMTETYWRK